MIKLLTQSHVTDYLGVFSRTNNLPGTIFKNRHMNCEHGTGICVHVQLDLKLDGSLEKDGLGKVFISVVVISRGIKGLQRR